MADGVNFPLDAPPIVVSTLMRALYHYTLLLKVSQERLQKAVKSVLAAGNRTSALPSRELATAKSILTADREWFGEATKPVLCQVHMMKTPGPCLLLTSCGCFALDAVCAICIPGSAPDI